MKKSVLQGFEWFIILGTIICTILFAFFGIGIKNAVSDMEWWITTAAAFINIFCVVLSAKGSKWNFIFGFLYNLLYAYYCVHTSHYGNAAVYGAFFLPMQIVGWLQWKKIGTTGEQEQVAAKRLTRNQRIWISAASVVIMVAVWFVLRAVGGQDSEVDAILMVICVIAQLLLTFAYMEQWVIWIAVNTLTIVMWTMSAFHGEGRLADLNIVICYIFTLINSINGLRVWLKLSSGEKE